MTNRRIKFDIAAVVLGIAVLGLSFLLPTDHRLAIVFFDSKSSIYPFTVQNVMWLVFFLGIGELCSRLDSIKENRRGLKAGYLSEQPDVFYGPEDIVAIRKKTYDKKDLLAKLINILTIRYQISNWAVGETHQMLNSQLELMQYRLDVNYSMIRFITWLLPSLGFIGTVMGISEALNAAGKPGASNDSEKFLRTLTDSLCFAFDTTLVALLMSTVLVYLMHLIQAREESTVEGCGAYCLENFVNKLMSRV